MSNLKLEVRDLHLLDKPMEQIREQQAIEFAKGNAANTDTLFALSCKVNALSHGSDAATQHTLKFRIMHESDDTNVKLVKKLSNKFSDGFQIGGGVIESASAVVMAGIHVAGGGQYADSIKLIHDTTSALARAAGAAAQVSKDEGGKQELQYAAQREQSEVGEKVGYIQTLKKQETDALGQNQQAQQSKANAFSAVAATIR